MPDGQAPTIESAPAENLTVIADGQEEELLNSLLTMAENATNAHVRLIGLWLPSALQCIAPSQRKHRIIVARGMAAVAAESGVPAMAALLKPLWIKWCSRNCPDRFDALNVCGGIWPNDLIEGHRAIAQLSELGTKCGAASALGPEATAEEEDDRRVDRAHTIALATGRADIKGLLPSIYEPLAAKAIEFTGGVIEPLAFPIFSVAGMQLHPMTVVQPCLRANVTAGGFSVSSIINVGLVGGISAGKTRIKDVAIAPLRPLQTEISAEFGAAMTAYRQSIRAAKKGDAALPDEPHQTALKITDFTREAVGQQLYNQPHRGLVIDADELVGFFRSFDQFKTKGNDRTFWLSSYNGGSIELIRVGKPLVVIPAMRVAVVGGMQPQIWADFLAREPEDGMMQRFVWIAVPDRRSPKPGTVPVIDMGAHLTPIYAALARQAPRTYCLSPEAFEIWSEWSEVCEDAIEAAVSIAVKALWPKIRELALRIALSAHCFEAAAHNKVPDQEFPAAILSAAITTARYAAGQSLALYGSDPATRKLLEFASKRSGKTIDWTAAYRAASPKADGRGDKSQCLEFLRLVVEAGLGKCIIPEDYSRITVTAGL
jgi:Protein of unknown function (DUF3987)